MAHTTGILVYTYHLIILYNAMYQCVANFLHYYEMYD